MNLCGESRYPSDKDEEQSALKSPVNDSYLHLVWQHQMFMTLSWNQPGVQWVQFLCFHPLLFSSLLSFSSLCFLLHPPLCSILLRCPSPRPSGSLLFPSHCVTCSAHFSAVCKKLYFFMRMTSCHVHTIRWSLHMSAAPSCVSGLKWWKCFCWFCILLGFSPHL